MAGHGSTSYSKIRSVRRSEVSVSARPTILLDASSLVTLCIPFDVPHGKLRRGLDVLYFLADHGFDVIVPEMVAYEIGKVLSDRRSRRDLSTDPKQYKPVRTYRPIFNDSEDFIFHLLEHPHPHIRIVPTENGTQREWVDYIRKVRQIFSMPDKEAANAKFHALPSIKDQQYGDIAAIDYVLSLPKDDQAPIYYLTEDYDNRNYMFSVEREPRVCKLNVAGMLKSALSSGMLNCVFDVPKDISARRLLTSLKNSMVCIGTGEGDTHRGRRTRRKSAHYQPIDSREPGDDATFHPFRDALDRLMKDMGISSGYVWTPSAPPPEAASRAHLSL